MNKKWDLDTMKIKIKNLEKIIPNNMVGMFLSINKTHAKSELDAYYITYYTLKDIFLKYNRSSFGDTTKNINTVYELNWEYVLNEHLIDTTATGLSSDYTKASINNSIYDRYMANNIVVDYDGRLIN